nr:MAG TPA: hypothetical protein [Caudoviricetes sp.]
MSNIRLSSIITINKNNRISKFIINNKSSLRSQQIYFCIFNIRSIIPNKTFYSFSIQNSSINIKSILNFSSKIH